MEAINTRAQKTISQLQKISMELSAAEAAHLQSKTIIDAQRAQGADLAATVARHTRASNAHREIVAKTVNEFNTIPRRELMVAFRIVRQDHFLASASDRVLKKQGRRWLRSLVWGALGKLL